MNITTCHIHKSNRHNDLYVQVTKIQCNSKSQDSLLPAAIAWKLSTRNQNHRRAQKHPPSSAMLTVTRTQNSTQAEGSSCEGEYRLHTIIHNNNYLVFQLFFFNQQDKPAKRRKTEPASVFVIRGIDSPVAKTVSQPTPPKEKEQTSPLLEWTSPLQTSLSRKTSPTMQISSPHSGLTSAPHLISTTENKKDTFEASSSLSSLSDIGKVTEKVRKWDMHVQCTF